MFGTDRAAPRGLYLTLFFTATFAIATPAQAGESVRVTASTLNVRSGPSTGNARIGQVHNGEHYAVVGRSGVWVRIQLDHRSGWSHGSYLRGASAGVFRTTASSLNVRSGASTRYRVLGRLPRNTPVAVSGSSGAWRKISHNGRSAWVHGAYLRADGAAAPAPAPAPSRPRSRAGFIQLPASGPGFVAYSAASKRWGKPALIYGAERASRRYHAERGGARVRIGNISLQNGGYMRPHSSHRVGEDLDVAPMRTDRREAAVTISQSAYSRTLTRRVIDFMRSEINVELILFNDRRVPGVRYYSGHHNHFHLRMR